MSEIATLEAEVNARWGESQWDWTIGKCPEGWFFYCGGGESSWAHKGYAPTLTAVPKGMLALTPDERQPPLTPRRRE